MATTKAALKGAGAGVQLKGSTDEKRDMAKDWYIIHTYSGFERKVAATLQSQIEAEGLSDHFGQIMVPTEDVIEMRQGKKVVTPKLFIPVTSWWKWK